MSDLRTGKRFPLELPVTVRDRKSTRKHAGTTSDVSAAGVYISAEHAFDVGSTVEFSITLPAEMVGGAKDVKIEGRGRVIRTDKAGEKKRATKAGKKNGIACVIDSYKFVRG